MKTKVLRIGQNNDDRTKVDVVLVGDPNWDSARITVRLPDNATLLQDLHYGTQVDVRLEVLDGASPSG